MPRSPWVLVSISNAQCQEAGQIVMRRGSALRSAAEGGEWRCRVMSPYQTATGTKTTTRDKGDLVIQGCIRDGTVKKLGGTVNP